MNSEFIRALLQKMPFEPFRVIMSNGESHLVTQREDAMLTRSTLVVYTPKIDHIGLCSLTHIAAVKPAVDPTIGV